MSKIAIVGCDASGKTVLISALSDYYKAGTRAGQMCIMVPSDAVTRRYTDNLHRIMRINREWPQATNDIVGGSTLNWTMMRNGKPLGELQLMDFGGENFRHAFSEDGTAVNEEVVARLKEYIAGADFVVITVSMDKMLRNLTPEIYRDLEGGDIEYDRDSEAQWVTGGLLKMVAAKLACNPPGVVVALTQADKHRDELREHGSAKALFAKCWPMIAAIHPDLNVVAVASIDKMSEAGLPAEGYRTDGVLTVMKEFVRYAFGDGDELCGRLEEQRAKVRGIPESADTQEFLRAIRRYREMLGDLHERTAMVQELYQERLQEFDKFIEECRSREEAACRDEARRQDEARQKLQQREEELRQQKPETPGGSVESPVEKPPTEPIAVKAGERCERKDMMIFKAAVLVLFAGAVGFWAWQSYDEHQAKIRTENEKQAAVAAIREREAAKAREAERERAEQQKAREEQARKAQEELRAKEEAERQRRAALEERRRQEEARRKLAAQKAAEEAEARRKQAEEAKRQQEEQRKREAERLAAERKKAEAERIAKETAEGLANLRQAVNESMLEPGRKLASELESRKLSGMQKKQLEQAKTFLHKLDQAQQGDREAMVWVGNQYYSAKEGDLVTADSMRALSWYRQAADVESPQANYFMSLLIEQGTGVKQDNALAGRYCLKAARLGYPEAMFWIGVYCTEGSHGFEKSPATAYKYLTKARDAGFRDEKLDSMIKNAEPAKEEETIDELYPFDPKLPPREKKKSYFFGLF